MGIRVGDKTKNNKRLEWELRIRDQGLGVIRIEIDSNFYVWDPEISRKWVPVRTERQRSWVPDSFKGHSEMRLTRLVWKNSWGSVRPSVWVREIESVGTLNDPSQPAQE